MSSQPGRPGPSREPAMPRLPPRAEVALRTMGLPNAIARQFDFWNDRYEGRRLFAELFGTCLLVLAAAGASMVDARFGGHPVPYDARCCSASTAARG